MERILMRDDASQDDGEPAEGPSPSQGGYLTVPDGGLFASEEELKNIAAGVAMQDGPQGGSERRDDNRTCILNALNFAANQFKQQFPADEYDRELIIISDMLEECSDSPFGRLVNIRKPDITQELKLADEFPEGNDLSSVKITIITPVTLETYVRHAPGKEPPMAELQKFWGAIFNRCKVTPEAQQKADLYGWSNGEVPRSLLAQTQ
jgi:hypothetical protein